MSITIPSSLRGYNRVSDDVNADNADKQVMSVAITCSVAITVLSILEWLLFQN